MKNITNFNVKTQGNGMDGKIVVNINHCKKIIPTVLFSIQESQRLLEIIDNMDSSYKHNAATKLNRFRCFIKKCRL